MISKNQIKHISSLEHKKFRDQYGVFVAEGPKVVNDLKGHFELVELFEGEDADKVSFLDTPQHLLAIFKKRVTSSADFEYSNTVFENSFLMESVPLPTSSIHVVYFFVFSSPSFGANIFS